MKELLQTDGEIGFIFHFHYLQVQLTALKHCNNRPLSLSSILVVVILLCSFEMTFAQYFNFDITRKRETASFKLVKNLIIIPIIINGKGPFNFILDSGVGLFLITEPSLSEIFPANTSRTISINGIGEGNEMTAFIQPSAKIKISNSISGEMPVAILETDPFNLSSFVGMPIHGLVGYELFSSFTIRINYLLKTITYYRNESAFIPRKGTKIPISIEDRKPYVNVDLTLPNGKKESVKLIIDTGAGHPLSLETNSGIPYLIPEKNIPANLGVGLSGMINGFISRIPMVHLGKFQLHNVICAFPDYSNVAAKIYSISRNGNMGNNILKRFTVVFDYQRSTLYLKPNYLLNEPFEHDMSGIEITSDGSNFEEIVIMRIESDSAAEKAGLKPGDRILSVNFKKITEIGLEEINNIFQSKNGRTVILEIRPYDSNEGKFIILTLQRRI